jgi:predicted DNA-binding transcriptional regulator AlpA
MSIYPSGAAVPHLDPLVNQAEAKNFIGISRTTLYYIRKNGVLHSIKIGDAVRFRTSDLERIASAGASTGAA